MPGWGEILSELQDAQLDGGGIDVDGVRMKYLTRLQELTGRSVVTYYTDFLVKGGPNVAVDLMDMQGLMEVFRELPGPDLDLILHSPGGSAEAADRLVRYTRTQFKHVRIFVPLAAMSAATMWAMSADEIVMGNHSQLGPIDPQLGGINPSGYSVPAGALIDQFNEAVEQCANDPSRVAGWLPTLQQYWPGLLNICEAASTLSQALVAEWLETYMHLEADKAGEIAAWLGNDKVHLSHGRAITREELQDQGVKVTALEDDDDLQDAVLSVHHANMHTLVMGTAVKLIENHLGRRFVAHAPMPASAPSPPPTP